MLPVSLIRGCRVFSGLSGFITVQIFLKTFTDETTMVNVIARTAALTWRWTKTVIMSYKRLVNKVTLYHDLGRNRMIGTPAKLNRALTVNAIEIPNRSESQPTNTTTAAVLRNEIIIYNPLAAPRFLPQ